MVAFVEPLADHDPRQVGGFRLQARLGAGGMGRVYLGYSPGGRPVAVKVVHPDLARDPEFMQRFRREVAAAQSVSDAYTAAVVGAGPDDSPPWLATTFVAGPSLADLVARSGRCPSTPCGGWPAAWPRRCRRSTPTASSTATSSRATSSSRPTGRASSTSASPGPRTAPWSPPPTRRSAPPPTCRPSRPGPPGRAGERRLLARQRARVRRGRRRAVRRRRHRMFAIAYRVVNGEPGPQPRSRVAAPGDRRLPGQGPRRPAGRRPADARPWPPAPRPIRRSRRGGSGRMRCRPCWSRHVHALASAPHLVPAPSPATQAADVNPAPHAPPPSTIAPPLSPATRDYRRQSRAATAPPPSTDRPAHPAQRPRLPT